MALGLTNIIIGCTSLPGTNTLAYLPRVIFTTLYLVFVSGKPWQPNVMWYSILLGSFLNYEENKVFEYGPRSVSFDEKKSFITLILVRR
jgi:hypothetical protein